MTTLNINPKSRTWAPLLRALADGKSFRIKSRGKVLGTVLPNLDMTPIHLTPEQEARFNARVAEENRRHPPVEFHSVKQTLDYLQERFGTDAHRDDRRLSGRTRKSTRGAKNRRTARDGGNP